MAKLIACRARAVPQPTKIHKYRLLYEKQRECERGPYFSIQLDLTTMSVTLLFTCGLFDGASWRSLLRFPLGVHNTEEN